MTTEYRYRDSNGDLKRKSVLNSNDHIELQDNSGNTVMDIEQHASRHAYGGEDAIADNSLHFSQIDKIISTSETKVSVAASSTSVIAKGIYYVRADSGVNVEYSTDGGTTWVQITAPSLIISDGSNVRFNNTNSSSANGYLLAIQ